MTVRAALVFLLAVGLTGCVTSGDQNPLKTDKGRDEARDAYIQLGLGYLQRGTPSRPRCRCARPSRSTLPAPTRMPRWRWCSRPRWSPSWPTRKYRKALASDSRNARVLNNYGGFLLRAEALRGGLPASPGGQPGHPLSRALAGLREPRPGFAAMKKPAQAKGVLREIPASEP